MTDASSIRKRPYSKPVIEFEKRIEALAVSCAGAPGNKQSFGASDLQGGQCVTLNT
jgi:hypothetical protein